jgi:carboxy-terminal domain RNA polymerase II polypeptide A small phosphatase
MGPEDVDALEASRWELKGGGLRRPSPMSGGEPQGRTLLILDVDETLIHASDSVLDRPADFRLFGYHIYRRPHLDRFIERVSAAFDLAVWSSAGDDYVRAVVNFIFPDPSILKFVWGSSRATLRQRTPDEYGHRHHDLGHLNYVKPLSKVARRGWNLNRVLIVDDTPEKCERNYGNAVYPAPFNGDPNDDELFHLATYLETLKDVPNVRRIEKRLWRARMLGE